MAAPREIKMIELVDVKITPMTADAGTAPTYGTSKDVPGVVKLTATPIVESKELKGDSQLLDVFARITGYELEVEHGILSLDVLAILQGGAVADTGTGTAEIATYSLTPSNVKCDYFKVEGKWNHGGTGVGDVHVVFYKCMATDLSAVDVSDASGDYGMPKFSAKAFPCSSSGAWMDIVVNETAVAIS